MTRREAGLQCIQLARELGDHQSSDYVLSEDMSDRVINALTAATNSNLEPVAFKNECDALISLLKKKAGSVTARVWHHRLTTRIVNALLNAGNYLEFITRPTPWNDER